MTKFSNPRKKATFDNWPSGNKRVQCTFEVESNKRGERVLRTTTGKPKKSTYYEKVVIVDGDDNKTYVLASTQMGMICIIESNLNYTHSVWSDEDRYEELSRLIKAA